MAYTPRLTRPEDGNPYYTVVAYGGLNECIEGYPAAWQGSALANCVGFAWGRAYELLGSRPNCSRGNGGTWWTYPDGYPRGQVAQLGAIACWDDQDGTGHVGVVEKIEGNIITMSFSGWGYMDFYTMTFTAGQYDAFGVLFQGFIYIPWNDDIDLVPLKLGRHWKKRRILVPKEAFNEL